jgi:hypothetical protein
MKRATFEALVAHTYQFEVIDPNGDSMLVVMRAPLVSEVWSQDREMPAKPEAPIKDIKRDEVTGEIVPIRATDDPDYQRAVTDWNLNWMYQRILLCWTESVPGETEAEQSTALAQLPNWSLSALWQCTQLVMATGRDAVRPFLGNGMESPDAVLPDALES